MELLNAENIEIKYDGVNKFDTFNFYISHKDLNFIGYEFELDNGVYVEEYGDIQYLFRMDVDKYTNEITVHSAYSEDYDVMEDATVYFDVDILRKRLEDHVTSLENKDEYNHGRSYIQYYEEQGVY